jgi:oxalate decarboxylase/phosphoglucose isomerase-like protein (cupin superfamily)
MQVLDLPPNLSEGYPEHDHAETGQEEVYAVLRGSGRMTWAARRSSWRPT